MTGTTLDNASARSHETCQ